MHKSFLLFFSLTVLPHLQASESSLYELEQRESCAVYAPERMPLFGDLHVHTALSLDANTQGTIHSPDDAYRYAKGESLYLQPFDDQGTSQRSSKLRTPLDFAGVTDHAELLGEVRMCQDEDSAQYNNLQCLAYRHLPKLAYFYMNAKASVGAELGMCGQDREACKDAAQNPWHETIAAAEAHYDRSADCSFTSFIGYEWTGAAYSGNNLHRNIIFNSSNVPDAPVSFYEAPSRKQLWSQLDGECSKDCEYVVIPHNSNLSNGFMFELPDTDEILIQSTKEPLVEIFQHKGSSECAPNQSDPLCNFEQLPYKDFRSKFQNDSSIAPNSSFIRDALGQGLALQETDSINPLKFGLIASTDTHLGTPGAVDEDSFQGHGGAGKSFRSSIPEGLPDDIEFNPGGLAVVWAEENSRTSIFNALQRKEVYGTSGPRFLVRFFAGDQLADDLCDEPNAMKLAYEQGVPMGGTLKSSNLKSSKLFISAAADPSLPNHYLQKLQVIKGVMKDGNLETSIHDIKVTDTPTSLNLKDCSISGIGTRSMCAVWQDPEFEQSDNAYYYVRVVANESCRWSHQLCLDQVIVRQRLVIFPPTPFKRGPGLHRYG